MPDPRGQAGRGPGPEAEVREVAVDAPLEGTLSYLVPDWTRGRACAGMRLLVPLGARLITGYDLGPGRAPGPGDGYALRAFSDLLDPGPLFPANMIPLFRWISDYYHHPLGEVIRTALPGGLSSRSSRRARLLPGGREALAALGRAEDWVIRLLEDGLLSPAATSRLWRRAADRALLRTWADQGWISVEHELVGDQVRPRFETVVRATGALCTEELRPAEYKTIDLLAELGRARDEAVPRTELNRCYGGAAKALRGLAARGLVSMEERSVYRNPFGERPDYHPRPERLTPEQEEVLASLLPAVLAQGFQAFLLHGVTGCGKTEVYLRAADRVLEQGLGVLVLVPEIALATQLEAHFISRFGDRVAVLHSGLSPGQRLDQWQRVLAGQAPLVLGARSAVFAPLERLGLVIVDEEHEPAYKQDDGLRYHGRDVAVMRARQLGCPVLLGSATPSVHSYHNAVTGKYRLLTMTRRVEDRPMPTVEVVDLRRHRGSGPTTYVSPPLLAALHDNFAARLQSLLFVNRRGYAGFMLCRDCGHIVQCRHCQVSLTPHRGQGRLVCHYCGYSSGLDLVCGNCGSSGLKPAGVGSERIEADVRLLLPTARVARLDSDVTSSRGEYVRILKAVRNGEVDVLVGTQMIAKGLHFPNMTLVGIVWADSGLGMPDFRASERTFQILSQVTGRAGRGERPGRVIVQTNQPEHYTVRFAREHNYVPLYEREVALRRDLGYPPFERLVNCKFSGPDEERVRLAAMTAAEFVRSLDGLAGLTVLGPAPAPLARLRDRSRYQLLLKSAILGELHRACAALLGLRASLCGSTVTLGIDVDPENMM